MINYIVVKKRIRLRRPSNFQKSKTACAAKSFELCLNSEVKAAWTGLQLRTTVRQRILLHPLIASCAADLPNAKEVFAGNKDCKFSVHVTYAVQKIKILSTYHERYWTIHQFYYNPLRKSDSTTKNNLCCEIVSWRFQNIWIYWIWAFPHSLVSVLLMSFLYYFGFQRCMCSFLIIGRMLEECLVNISIDPQRSSSPKQKLSPIKQMLQMNHWRSADWPELIFERN